VVVGALLVAGGGFLPWGASGRAERHSYALVGVVDRLDVLDGAAAFAARSWYLAPLVAAGVWTAAALGRRTLAHGLAAALAVGGTMLALAVRASPLLDRPGPYATIAGAGVVGVGLLLALAERGRNDLT
jgi:hypothetical protein